MRKFQSFASRALQILDTIEIPCSEFFADNYKNYNQDKEIIDLLNNLSVERKNTFIDLMRCFNHTSNLLLLFGSRIDWDKYYTQ